MINTNMPSNFANAITPYSPLGRQPVGQESPDNRNTPLKPVEQSAESSRSLYQRNPDDYPSEVAQRDQLRDRASRNANKDNADDSSGSSNKDSSESSSSDTRKSDSRNNSDSRNDVNEQRQQDRRAQQLLEAERQQVRQLAERDAEVRAHERAHSAVGGDLAGAPRYQYERGPNGQNYAVSGEVAISVTEIDGDPEATLEMARQVRRAALAPAEPSSQDRQVAARATQIEMEAQQEIVEQQRDQLAAEQQAAIEAREQQQIEEKIREQRDREREREEEKDQAVAAEQASTVPATEPKQTAADRFAEINSRSFELNRRLVEIGATATPAIATTGGLFDQTV